MSMINKEYEKIDWRNTPVYENKSDTNNNKLDMSLEEAKILYMDCLHKDILVNGAVN